MLFIDENIFTVAKSSAVTEMGDRGHNRYRPKKGAVVPLTRGAGTPSKTMWPGPRSTSVRVASSSIQPFSHNRHGPNIGWGWVCPFFSGASWVPIVHKLAWAAAYLHTKWHLSPSTVSPQRPLAETCAPLGEGELCSHLTQCRVGLGLPPYQVAS